ncbi:MAG: phospholipid carrier-dependent glycosyltransferase [Anaerolineae bacterium]|nr:phospholipid carrier-dependent glycosyltransferase [Anaerolineae bacterium]
MSRFWMLDTLWLLALILFAAAGLMLAPFHGDEAMHIYTSTDYATAYLNGQPGQLPVAPPYDIDSDPRLRLLNGSVMRYSIGLSWHLRGLTPADLPQRPGWDWGIDYDQNIANGRRPSEPLLASGRIAALVYLAGSIAALFGIGRVIAGRPLAYLASALYALHPVILLNGRRSLVESALLCFGLLLMLIALQIVRRHAEGRRGLWAWWAALTVTAALTLASKYSGTIFVAAAYGGIGLAAALRYLEMLRIHHRGTEDAEKQSKNQHLVTLLSAAGRLIVSGALAIVLLVAISPALWNDPLARARDLTAMLQEQVDIVVSILPDAPTTLAQRIEGIITQPFIAAPQFFEQAAWANARAIADEIQRYMASPLSGVQYGLLLGTPLTLLAAFGILAACWPRLRPYQPGALSLVLLVWLLVVVANLLINPLPWQRYYLALIPPAALFAGLGILAVLHLRR